MRVLFFKVNQLGDNVVFLPVVQEMRRRFPSWELSVFTSPTAAPLYQADIAAERLTVLPTPDFNGSWKRPWQLVKLWRKASGFAPDACLISDDQANVAYLLAYLSGSPVRVGVRRNFIRLGYLANEVLPGYPDERVALTNWRIAGALVKTLGGDGWPDTPPPPDLSHMLTTDAPAADARPRVVIHTGAARAYQRWLPERYVALANRLRADGHWQVDWIETPDWSPEGLSEQVNRVQTRNLEDLVRCVGGAALYVGNNTGPMHIANALGRRCVIINGPTRRSWDPMWYSERMLMLRDVALPCLPCDTIDEQAQFCRNVVNPMACMKSWSVEAIYERCLDWAQRPEAGSAAFAAAQKQPRMSVSAATPGRTADHASTD